MNLNSHVGVAYNGFKGLNDTFKEDCENYKYLGNSLSKWAESFVNCYQHKSIVINWYYYVQYNSKMECIYWSFHKNNSNFECYFADV